MVIGLVMAGLAISGCHSGPPAVNVAPVCPPTESTCRLTTPMRWAVAIDPPASSGLPPTQQASALVTAEAPPWQVDAPSTVLVTLSPPAGTGVVPPQAQVVLSIPTAIPGSSDLSFQAPLAPWPDGRAVASLTLPSSALKSGALVPLALQPLPPGDQTLPSYQWRVPLSASITLPLPGDDVLIHGQLLSAGNRPLSSQMVARAFQNGQQVSNAPLVRSDGQFELRIPSAAVANPVTLSLAPTSRSSSDPSFLSTPFMASAGQNLGIINLPAYVLPAGIFTVTTQDPGGNPLGGILISAVTPLGDAVVSSGGGGSATFQNAAVTDRTGIAQLSLLPGTNTRITYFVLATPPLGSPYAIQCVNAMAGSGAALLTSLKLAPRPVLSGTVQLADGSPAPNVTVTASGTPDPPSPNIACLAPSPISIGTTTDAEGKFSLPLDAGTYRIDYDPPPGSLVPRKTTDALMIQSDLDLQTVTLLPGTWLTGTVVGPDPDRLPVASAAVRFFELCSDPTTCPGSLAPSLVAATFTDAEGGFQVAVPAPAAPTARAALFDTAGAGP